MESQLVAELAHTLNLPPLVIIYLLWLGAMHFKRSKQLDIAFDKIRAIEKEIWPDGRPGD